MPDKKWSISSITSAIVLAMIAAMITYQTVIMNYYIQKIDSHSEMLAKHEVILEFLRQPVADSALKREICDVGKGGDPDI